MSRRNRYNVKALQASENSLALFLSTPEDIAGLVVLRVAFGFLLLWEVCRYFWNGWVQEIYITPTFHFSYFGFSWLRPLPGGGMVFCFLGLGVLAVMVAIGMKYWIAAPLFCLGFTYVFLLERAEYLNHFYLTCLLSFLLAILPAHRAGSWDAWKNPSLRSGTMPRWVLWSLRTQVAIPYVYGGFAKLNDDWLHGQPMNIWMSRMEHLTNLVPFFGDQWLALAFSYGGLLFDLLIVPLLLCRRTQFWAFGLAVLFHLLNAIMFQIGIFPWMMICLTTIFLSPDWPRRFFRDITTKSVSEKTELAVVSKSRLVFLVLFFGFQLLLPFRHFAYGKDVDWTEYGNQFAWRMMLTDKASAIRLEFIERQSRKRQPLNWSRLLTERQVKRLGEKPELLSQFARYLHAELLREEIGDFEIRATVLCSLNGRKPQLLVDPSVDLATAPQSFGTPAWVEPLREPRLPRPFDLPPDQWEQAVILKPGSN